MKAFKILGNNQMETIELDPLLDLWAMTREAVVKGDAGSSIGHIRIGDIVIVRTLENRVLVQGLKNIIDGKEE